MSLPLFPGAKRQKRACVFHTREAARMKKAPAFTGAQWQILILYIFPENEIFQHGGPACGSSVIGACSGCAAVQGSNGPGLRCLPNKKPEAIASGFLFGGRYRTRTCDLLHVKQMLYQLS